MIKIENVTFSYPGSNETVLSNLDLTIKDGEFLCVIGHSGCGKSTLLRLVAGLDAPAAGAIVIDGEPVNGPRADRTIVFQQYSLFPWLTVKKNVQMCIRDRYCSLPWSSSVP